MMSLSAMEKQRGAALLMALFLVALLALLATDLFFRESIVLQDQSSAKTHLQVESDWFRLEGMTMAQLAKVAKQQGGWFSIPAKHSVISLSGRDYHVTLSDAQAKLNINQVGLYPAPFAALLRSLDASLRVSQVNSLIQYLQAWTHLRGVASDAYYQALPTPYRSAHAIMVDRSELALVKGFGKRSDKQPPLYASVASWIIALPAPIKLNALDARPVVIHDLLGERHVDQANVLVLCQKAANGMPSRFFRCLQTQHQVLPDFMGVQSHFVLLDATAVVDHHVWHKMALLADQLPNDPSAIHVVYAHDVKELV